MKIFLDLDGTILNIWPKLYYFYQTFLKKHNRSFISFDEFVNMKTRIGRSGIAYETILKKTNSQDLAQEYLEKFEKTIEDEEYLKKDQFYDKYIEILRGLKGDLYLLTGRKNRKTLLQQLNRLKILSLFKKIISCENVNEWDLKSFKLEALKNNADKDSIFVGDTEVDIQAGRQAGVISIAVQYGIRERSILEAENPDYFILDLNSLPDIIKVIQE